MVNVSGPAKQRLLYLMRLLEKNGPGPVTSAEIEALTGWASHTIRKDISFLGGEGALGSSAGYDPAALAGAIKNALGLGRRRLFCVVGLGRLGSAYLNFRDLGPEAGPGAVPETGPGTEPRREGAGFELAAGFDTNVNRVEILKSPAPLYPAYKMGEVIRRFGIEIALLCVPPGAAQGAAEKLAAAGIRGIINFAPAPLKLGPEIAVRNVFLVDELRALAVQMEDTPSKGID
ncbi:MAG: CoA-binding protein [Treponema sp.]|jgi:redox-sensing transcriptional repressor|nr:CoA-binding protein [Treponema sp.]